MYFEAPVRQISPLRINNLQRRCQRGFSNMSQTLAATRLMRSSPIEAAACEAVSNDVQCIYPKCPLLVFGKQLADELNAGKLVSRRSAASMLRASTGKCSLGCCRAARLLPGKKASLAASENSSWMPRPVRPRFVRLCGCSPAID
jgi:hypothetical protein